MMMPANYSVVAENEMTYVVGGGIADVLAPMMTAKNVQNIVVNTITMVGSYFVNTLVNGTLSAVFKYNFLDGTDTLNSSLKEIWTVKTNSNNIWGSIANVGLRTVGVLSAIYTMGVSTVGPKFDGILNIK